MAKQSDKPLDAPFTILIDQREKAPYFFHGIRAGANRSHRPLVIPTQFHHLPTGDYSILGLEDRITIERKSLADLYSTLGSNRDRFEAEHVRMAQFEFAAVIVESSMAKLLLEPPKESRLNPKSVHGTYLSWSMRYGVQWLFAEDRRLAEKTTWFLLNKFFEEKQHQLKLGKEAADHGNIGCNANSPVFNLPAGDGVTVTS